MATEKPESHQEIIDNSWDRCRTYGLTHSSEININRPQADVISDIVEANNYLVHTTHTEVLPYYEHILSNTECLIMLADHSGRVLDSWGDQRFMNSERKAMFEQGVAWQERSLGTNAIGTALATGQPVQIERDEHFLKANRFMVGSAAPIYDVNRELVGVIDVSSDAYLPQAHTLGMVKMMTQSVENRLIISMFKDEAFTLTFNTNLDILDSQWSGLIVFNEEGSIISANRRAELLLAQDLALLNIESILNISLRELKSHPEELPLDLVACNKFRVYGMLKRPNKPKPRELDFRKQQKTNKQTFTLESINLGDSKLKRAIDQASRVIEKDIPILIHGETGVGKEVFVKALHNSSSRAQMPLVALNCAAIPADLVESELFGYEKGAFTGANNKGSIGLIRKAHKGTLFLDELGDMPHNVQARLLRVLQERQVTPLGSTENYSVDVRLISATHKSLKNSVAIGEFRQDLFYRVSGLNISIPALREREDKQLLFQQVLNHYSEANVAPLLSANVTKLFSQYSWPGNIRQLVSVLQIAEIMSDGQSIQLIDLPDDFINEVEEEQQIKEDETFDHQPSGKQDNWLAVFEANDRNVSRTAKALNISRNTLYKKLRELDLK
ncbi:Sigma-54 Specific Transcriptional Regulator containing GAF, and FisDNA-binding domains [Marinomonas sp. MED121]|uniref:sigma-54-dependent Fis family transcriptional regulator n=1 Tax=Marinomonas sp. MED121 TaxID=314277 RepID=UPI000068FD2B|nr:sigma-54-dependent Fis family transcriptional regulator [Marinomonas sp. MED121]EAQ63699.1 Sigma-54 Specific Transcriptional Regulator containing GAF, and FisDNA-binding domains [Marinomonas sp. MED121]